MTRDVCLRNKAISKYNTVITTKVKRIVTFGKKELSLGYMQGLLQQLADLFCCCYGVLLRCYKLKKNKRSVYLREVIFELGIETRSSIFLILRRRKSSRICEVFL